MNRDPNILTSREAARLAAMSDQSFRDWFDSDDQFRESVQVTRPGTFRYVSLPRLCRYIHHAEADEMIPTWREQVAADREPKSVAS